MDTASMARASAARILTYPYGMRGPMIVIGPVFFGIAGIALFSISQTSTFDSLPPLTEIIKLTAWAINLVWHVGLDEGTRIAFAGLATLCIAFALFALGTEIVAHGAGSSLVVGPSTISVSGRPWGNRTLAFADVASVKVGSVRTVRFLKSGPTPAGRWLSPLRACPPAALSTKCVQPWKRGSENNPIVISGASRRI